MDEVIEVCGLRKLYGSVVAVDDVSFGVRRGEIFGILGPNGAGKTTTVESIAGLRRPDRGEVRVLGLDPQRDGRAVRQLVGVQLQQAMLPERLKVGEALELFASFYQRPADWEHLVEQWGLTEKRNAVFASLSGGQRQRLFIALALVGDPQVVILDELTSGLDPQARRATWELVRAVRDAGTTVVLVTHFMDEAERLCERLVIIDEGRIVTQGSPRDLVAGQAVEARVSFTANGSDLLVGAHGPVDAWERWAPAWHAVFYVVLGLSSVVALAEPSASWAKRGPVLAVAAVLAGWYWLWAIRRPIWDRPLLQVVAYLAGAAGLWVVLLVLHEAFFLVAFSAYAQVFGFLPSPRSAVPGAVALTGLLVVIQAIKLENPTPAPFLIGVTGAAVGVLLSLWVDAIIRQSQDRRRLIDELESTQAELAAAERQAGILEERQRLAAEIHDTLAQGFTSIVTLLEASDAQLAVDQTTARRHLTQARQTARDNLAEARRFVWALQPEALTSSSLPEALHRLGEQLQEEAGVRARIVVTGRPAPMPQQGEIALLRAAQEGLANIRKHAHASDVVLTLSYAADQVILDVKDDGRGFDTTAHDRIAGDSSGGLGLRGLRARLAALGGLLNVESTPGEGTVLVAQLPIVNAGGEPPDRAT